MIPVTPQPEPTPGFDLQVRRPGRQWLATRGLDPDGPAPRGTELEPYWRACLPELHDAYDHVCAYLCTYLERAAGGDSVDHFVPKSRHPGLAYAWTNYRLACLRANSRKRDHQDVLDPFTLTPGTFHLELITGRIYPNPALPPPAPAAATQTIARLGLDDADCRELRARHCQHALSQEWSSDVLRRYSPFVWSEARRQGVLRCWRSTTSARPIRSGATHSSSGMGPDGRGCFDAGAQLPVLAPFAPAPLTPRPAWGPTAVFRFAQFPRGRRELK